MNYDEFMNLNKSTKKPQRGEVYYIQSGSFKTTGCEQQAGRPAVIVSNNNNNSNSDILEIAYLTAQTKTPLPTHVETMATGIKSTILCEQIWTISNEKIGKYKGKCTDSELELLDKALAISIGIKKYNLLTNEENCKLTDSVIGNFDTNNNNTLIQAKEYIDKIIDLANNLNETTGALSEIDKGFKVQASDDFDINKYLTSAQLEKIKLIATETLRKKLEVTEFEIRELTNINIKDIKSEPEPKAEPKIEVEISEAEKEEGFKPFKLKHSDEPKKSTIVEWNTEEVKEMLKAGKIVQEIADKYNITKGATYKKMAADGISPKQYKKPR